MAEIVGSEICVHSRCGARLGGTPRFGNNNGGRLLMQSAAIYLW